MSKTLFCFIQTGSFGLACVSLVFVKTMVWGLKSSVGFWLLFCSRELALPAVSLILLQVTAVAT